MKRKILKKIQSFTLIELLTTTVIIAVFFGLSLGGYRFFDEQRVLEEETKNIVETLELAKKMAVTGQIPRNYTPENISLATCATGKKLNGEFLLTFYGSIYGVGGAVTNTKNNANCNFGALGKVYVLPDNITLINMQNGLDFGNYGFKAFGIGVQNYTYYNPLNGVSTPSPLDAQGGFSLKITNTTTGKFKIITVDRAGTITIL